MVTSPLSNIASKSLVAKVGSILTDRIPAPLSVTPAGIVRGNISEYTPG